MTFLTNNSERDARRLRVQARPDGIDAAPDVIGTSAQAAAVARRHRARGVAAVLVCAGAGVREALTGQGFEPVDDGPADAVVVGWHREFDFERLTRPAADVARRGAPFVATNSDSTYPVPGGFVPGAGARRRGGADGFGARPPWSRANPKDPTVALVRRRWGPSGVVVGDRPSTDGALARCPRLAVRPRPLRGSRERRRRDVPDPPPPFVAADFAALAPALVSALVRADAISVEADPSP